MTEAEVRAIVAKVVTSFTGSETASTVSSENRVAIGGDHGGFLLKSFLAKRLAILGYQVHNCGTDSADAVDYPDIAASVARAVANGSCFRGIVIDGAGIGSSMAANKIKGVRAALCYNEKTILNSRVHNDANVLTLGAGFHSEGEAEAMVKLWLETAFEGGRHQKRIDKIMALERSN